MRIRKQHVAGMFILLLIIPTVVFLSGTWDPLSLLLVVFLEACMGISLFLLRSETMPRRKFCLGLTLFILLGLFLIAAVATAPYWIFHVMGWRLP
jgi:hypothetical protein